MWDTGSQLRSVSDPLVGEVASGGGDSIPVPPPVLEIGPVLGSFRAADVAARSPGTEVGVLLQILITA